MTVQVHLDPTAVMIEDANGGRFEDDAKVDYAYATTESGLLRVLAASKSENDWRILTEFAPSAWRMVTGKRYEGDSGVLRGVIGTSKPWHAVAD